MDHTIHTIPYQTDSATWAEGQCESRESLRAVEFNSRVEFGYSATE
jgi:hypothetical protein